MSISISGRPPYLSKPKMSQGWRERGRAVYANSDSEDPECVRVIREVQRWWWGWWCLAGYWQCWRSPVVMSLPSTLLPRRPTHTHVLHISASSSSSSCSHTYHKGTSRPRQSILSTAEVVLSPPRDRFMYTVGMTKRAGERREYWPVRAGNVQIIPLKVLRL